MSKWSVIGNVDPHVLASRYSNEDSFSTLDTPAEEPDEISLAQATEIKKVLHLLPAREADFVELYYFKHLKQTDIAILYRVSQPTVCYRLQRAVERIKYLIAIPHLTQNKIKEDLKPFLKSEIDIDIMALMYLTTCQSETAKLLGVTQGLIRHRFLRSIKTLKKDPEAQLYYELFYKLSNNLNILREIHKDSNKVDFIII